MRRRRGQARARAAAAGALAGALALLSARGAAAGVEDTFGIGTRPMALGGSFAARTGNFASAYYNPAGLVAPGERGGFFEASIGFLYAHPELWATRADGATLTTPEVPGASERFGNPDTAGLLLGTRFSVGAPFHLEGLDAGFALYLPPQIFRWAIRPDDDVQWALLQDRTQVLSFDAGLAYRVTKWLSLGAGARVLFDVQTLTRGQVTYVKLDTDPQTGKTVVRTGTRLGVDSQVFGRVVPVFGAMVTPTERLRFGVVYRHQSYVDDWGNTRIVDVPSFGDLGYTHHFAHYFEPSTVVVAAGADLGHGLDVSADFSYVLWSEAKTTNRNTFGSAVWGNTLVPAFGAEWRAGPALSLMGGYRFQKSPLDNLGGPTNLLDCDRHVVSLGFDLGFLRALGVSGFDPRLVGAASYTLLASRSETKDARYFASDRAWTSNAGFPSYTYGGHLIGVSAAVEAKF